MNQTHSDDVSSLKDEAWALLRETECLLYQQAQEAEKRFQKLENWLEKQAQESDRKAQEAEQEAKKRLQEAEAKAEQRFQEDERWRQEHERWQQEHERWRREHEQSRKEAEREAQRRAKDFERSSKLLEKRIGDLGSRLGDFVEGFIKPSIVRLFKERGIQVHKVFSDVSTENAELNLATQIDLLALNEQVCVLVEVKSKFSTDDVKEHLQRMEKFKPLFPEYADKRAFGAIAAMVMPDDVAKYAYRKGFFVLAQQGESVIILNDEKFKPMVW